MLDIRDVIQPAIEAKGYKQAVVAARCGMSDQQLTDVIKKRRRLEANEMIAICKAIDITPNDLLVMSIPKGRAN